MRSLQAITLALSVITIIASCKREVDSPEPGPINPATEKFSYGDSVFYLKSQSYTISPTHTKTGSYTAFPDNLLLDNATGKVTVTITGKGQESQTGMKYKIVFTEAGTGAKDSTYIILSGINYLDRIFYLSQNDSILRPVYNNNLSAALPAGKYGIQADNELAINPVNGEINLNECVRRGLFDRPAENGEWEELTINYQLNDNSNNVTNRLDIALYYYDRLRDIPSNISIVMRAHQTMMLGVTQPQIPLTSGPVDDDLPDNLSIARPRPPCIVIVAN